VFLLEISIEFGSLTVCMHWWADDLGEFHNQMAGNPIAVVLWLITGPPVQNIDPETHFY
jgi:hypothetical protein